MKAVGAARERHGNDLLHALADKRGAPMGVHLQVADRCNHACAHCYQIQGMKGELGLDDVKAVLDGLAAAGVLVLNVSGGEATLRDDLLDILGYARRLGFAVRLYTNAFLVDDALADRLAAVGLYEVHVSVYSRVATEHDAVTRVPGSLARTLGGVRALRARGVRVVLKCPATSLAPSGPAGVAALASELGCGFAASTEITPMEDGSLASQAVAASPEDLVRTGLVEPWTPSPGDAARRAYRLSGAPCGVGTSGLVVLSNGEVRACTDTLVPLGDLTRQGLREVLRDSADAALFRELTWGDVHGCRDCDLLLACHRCHATALHEGGDYLGPYPRGCARARARYAAGVGGLEVLAPAPGCEPGRDPRVGPYKIESPGKLRPVPDVKTDEDERRAAQHPWIRPDHAHFPRAGEGGTTAGLIRLRRGREHPA